MCVIVVVMVHDVVNTHTVDTHTPFLSLTHTHTSPPHTQDLSKQTPPTPITTHSPSDTVRDAIAAMAAPRLRTGAPAPADGTPPGTPPAGGAQEGVTQEGPLRVMLLCGADLLATMVQPGVWQEAQLRRLLDEYGVVAVGRYVERVWCVYWLCFVVCVYVLAHRMLFHTYLCYLPHACTHTHSLPPSHTYTFTHSLSPPPTHTPPPPHCPLHPHIHSHPLIAPSTHSEGTSLRNLVTTPNTLLYEYRHNIIIVDEPVSNGISSTLVRTLLTQGEPVRYLIPEQVLQYIHANGLYTK